MPLNDFSLEGGSRRSLRKSHKRMLEEGCQFEILPAPLDDITLGDLKRSFYDDAWMGEKPTAEKSFSMGSFQPE